VSLDQFSLGGLAACLFQRLLSGNARLNLLTVNLVEGQGILHLSFTQVVLVGNLGGRKSPRMGGHHHRLHADPAVPRSILEAVKELCVSQPRLTTPGEEPLLPVPPQTVSVTGAQPVTDGLDDVTFGFDSKNVQEYTPHVCQYCCLDYPANLAVKSSSETSEVWQNRSLRQTARALF
jgi:hypothetical protein